MNLNVTLKKVPWLVTCFLACIIFLTRAFASELPRIDKNEADIDPIIFSITSNKPTVRLNEDVDITITCSLRPYWSSQLAQTLLDANFKIKLVLPDGFVQTGGNYTDFIGDKLSYQKPTVQYKLRGRFERASPSNNFVLLRGTEYSVEVGKFLYRGSLSLNVKDQSMAGNQFSNARTTDYNQCLESENMTSATGAVTSDPNASNGQTRGLENQYSHYVDYVLPSVPSAGTYQVTLTYYSSSAPTVNVTVNGTGSQTINLSNSGSWNIVYTTQTFNVTLAAGSNTIRINGTGGGSCRQDKICVVGSGGPSCTTPSAPTISKTAGSTVCAATSQSVTLTASGCTGGTITWYKDGNQVGTGTSITRTDAGNYTATCTDVTCVSTQSAPITVTQTSGCGTGSNGCVPNKVRLIFRFPGECCMDRLVGAKIQGSNNGTSWIDLYTFNQNGNGSWQEFTFPNSTSYTSLRFVASSTGWGEIAELEFYNGNTKLVGTSFGQGNYALAFDGNTGTKWEGTSAGTSNIIGLNLTGCGGPVCTTPSAPTISKTAGTTVCAATPQSVTLTATGCSGTITWFRDGVQVGTGATITTTNAGVYTAKCTVEICVSNPSSSITVMQTSGCGGGTSVTPKISSSGFPEVLNLTIVADPANPGSWLISDIGTVGLPSGYEWSYFVGNKWIRRSTNLSNEPWQTNNPGRVIKMATKLGMDTLNRWPCPMGDCSGGYYQPDAVAQLIPGARGGLTTFIFN